MLGRTIALKALLLLPLLLAAPPVDAQERWTVERVETGKYPPEILPEKRSPAPSGIPSMLMSEAPQSRDIVAAWYSQPTSRYRHGALGDTIEGGALTVRLKGGRQVTLRLPETQVFEDIAPRIVDLDMDGSAEIVAIVASLTAGAAVQVFGMSGDSLVRKASSPFLGTPNRWLNIAAIHRFTSRSSTPEIAFVAKPHLEGKLGFLKYVPGSLLLFASDRNFSNHVNGSTELRLSAVADIDEDGRMELVLPSFDRKSLRIMDFTTNGLVEAASARLPAAIDKAILAEGEGRRTSFVVGLEDGTVWRVRR